MSATPKFRSNAPWFGPYMTYEDFERSRRDVEELERLREELAQTLAGFDLRVR